MDALKQLRRDYFSNRIISMLLLLMMAGCTTIQTLTNNTSPSPYDTYSKNLKKSELTSTAMCQSWLRAGDVNLHDSILVTLPFQETGYFASAEPQARFYRFDVKTGQVLTLTSLIKAKETASVFIDVFFLEVDKWVSINHADSSMTLNHEFAKTGTCLVRLQPELLVNAFYSITLSVTPVLMNPVKGATNKSIGSFYGDPRDAGKRKHEGVDIFAPKGTFVIAPTAGVVTKVASSKLGGKTVWMNDLKRDHSYYFAHLDSQFVKPGARVKQGDVLGTVGNTGNAKYTPAHLHFGVYQRDSKDPISYIRTMEKLVNALAPDTLFQSVVFRVNPSQATVHAGPSVKAPIFTKLGKGNYVRVIGQSQEWYRVITAEAMEGFIEKKKIVAAEKGKQIPIRKSTWLTAEATVDAVPIVMLAPQTAEELASYKNFRYIKTTEGLTGWIDSSN